MRRVGRNWCSSMGRMWIGSGRRLVLWGCSLISGSGSRGKPLGLAFFFLFAFFVCPPWAVFVFCCFVGCVCVVVVTHVFLF